MERQYTVTGMHCSGCASRVERKALAVPGVKSAKVNLVARCLTVHFSGDADDEGIIKGVTAAGFQCEPMAQENPSGKETLSEQAQVRRRLIPSFFIWLAIAALMLLKMMRPEISGAWIGSAQLLLTLGVFWVNRQIFVNGFKRLLDGPDMDTLVAIGSAASFLLSLATLVLMLAGRLAHAHFYFESASMILVIVTFGKYLEAGAKAKAGQALEKLKSLAPDRVLCLVDGVEREIPASQVQAGQTVVVRPGTRIPFDGLVTSGASSVDESTLTGESLPRDVEAGAKVFAGTMNLTGRFTFEATGVGQDTLLAGIIRIVSESSLSRSRSVRLADAIAARFVPLVMGIAALTFGVWMLCGGGVSASLSMAISVLVVSCPCALGLATPVAVTIAMGRAARSGIVFKSGDALEKLCTVGTVCLDKTGTVTTGRLQVTDVVPADGVTVERLLFLAASAESGSEHPIARAVVSEAEKRSLVLAEPEGFVSTTGRGVCAIVEGRRICAGNGKFVSTTEGVDAEPILKVGKSVLFVTEEAQEGSNAGECQGPRCIGMIALRDQVGENNREGAAQMKSLGLELVLLTGDNEACARAIADECGIGQVRASLLPAEKADFVKGLKESGHRCAMVGDGINDAPALASADVGIAVGTGTDIAVECADIVMMKPALCDVAEAVRLSRATVRNVRQNLFWAFFYNLLLIPVAAGVLVPFFGFSLNPMVAAGAMSLSSICVVCNALRLRLPQRDVIA